MNRRAQLGLGEKVLFYLSNMLPTFIAMIIIYGLPLSGEPILFKAISWALIMMTIVSIAGLFQWVRYLRSLDERSIGDEKQVKETNEITTVVSNYILAYAASVISTSVVGGTRGILLFAILVIIFGLYAFSWNAMLFNPLLMLKGYRIYWMGLQDGSTGYLICKLTGGPIISPRGKSYAMIKIDDYLYYLNKN